MASHPGPILESERFSSLDTLRGFAVLGILVMNIQAYSMPLPAYLNPHALGPLVGVDWWIWLASHTLADRKFITLFSIMFGAGIILFTTRAEGRGLSPARLHYRRLFVLLLFGLAHAHLPWYGDILFTYAVCGMLVYPLRKLAPRRLLLIGLLVMAVGSALYIFFGWSMQFWPPEQIAALEADNWRPPQEKINWDLATYRGGWLLQMRHRVPQSFFLQVPFLLMYELWRAGGLMLIGMALYKWGVLTAQRSRAFYGRLIAIGLLVGIPMTLYGVYRNVQAGWNIRYSFFLGPQWNYWSGVLVAFAYAGLVMLACQSGVAAGLTQRLAAVGRMAFTNYIMHTLICTTIFYGHGFGLYGRVPRPAQIAMVLAIFALQMLYSPLWLRYFRFGPLEWLWRSLTYGAAASFRRA